VVERSHGHFSLVQSSVCSAVVCIHKTLVGQSRHRVIAIPDLEAAIRPRVRLNCRKEMAGQCRLPKTPFVVPIQTDEASSSKETMRLFSHPENSKEPTHEDHR
jgi:hypothetical protein